jgi:predicted alpha-1,2-mannosidase
MKKKTHIALFVLAACCAPVAANLLTPADYVDPRIGNVSRFLVPTYPTFQQPNQMLRMFPIKADYISDEVQAFPLQVIRHRSAGLFQVHVSLGPVTPEDWSKPMAIDHDLEVVHPWHYETTLIEDDITVAFTPGKIAAIYRFDFPKAGQKNILVAGSGSMAAKVVGDHAFSLVEKYTNRSRSPAHTPVEMSIWCYGEVTDAQGKPVTGCRISAEKGRLRIESDATGPETVQLKYAVSYVSELQARKNFAIELADENFDGLAAAARSAWDAELGRIQVTGGTVAQKRTFYTSLYRTHERMVDINEHGHYYSGYDQQIHASNRPFYVDDWIWDTFRAHHPLRTILNPAQEEDMLQSYVEMSRQAKGWMPTFPGVAGNEPCMNCYHSSAIFLDAHRKGLKNFDLDAAYGGVRKNLTQGSWIPWRQGAPATALDRQMSELGFMPALRPGEKETESVVDGFERRQAVAVSLGRSYDTWVMSEWAKELGNAADQKTFADISSEYKKLWHPEQRLFMPRDSAGEWIDIDPKSAGGPGYRDYFDENNGWTYAWLVQHDIPGLMELLGGPKAMVDRLDQLFREPLGMRRREFYNHGANSTGMVGQFSMGNEPSFHIPYLYNYCGAPWKTQQRTRFLLDVWFKDNIFGIPGDEDGGGMTAWVVFTAMGFYPVTPGVPVYTITSPVFSEVAINLDNGKQFKVVAPDASARNKYIQKAELNGEPLDTPFMTHDQIMAGGTLRLELGERPNRNWGVQ